MLDGISIETFKSEVILFIVRVTSSSTWSGILPTLIFGVELFIVGRGDGGLVGRSSVLPNPLVDREVKGSSSTP